MYHFVNFGAHGNTLNSTFTEILKTVKLLIQKFIKWHIYLVS